MRSEPKDVVAVKGEHVLVDGSFRPATLLLGSGSILGVEPLDHPVAGEVVHAPPSAHVVPGMVDTHVHVNEPGRTAWEGFATATLAAVLGGVTTVVDMPLNSIPPTTTAKGLLAKQDAARGQLAVDVAFWGGAVPGNLSDLEPLHDLGVMGFKCFLSPSGVDEFPPLDTGQLHQALREVARLGALMVVHAEDPDVLDAAPHRASRAYADFLLSRPDEAETVAVRRLIDGARLTGARVHVLHVSSARVVDLLAEARAEGLPVTAETCPHYLCLDAGAIPDAAPEYKCCPPIRDAANREQLWQALVAGVIDVVVSDHSPATAEEKRRGDGDLQQAWGGVAGLQVGFTAVAAEARARGIGLEHVVRWMSTGTADLVGLRGKGRIETGADADLVVLDLAGETEVRAEALAHRNPITAYDGLRLSGRVTHTLVAGRAGVDHRRGRMLRRALGQPA